MLFGRRVEQLSNFVATLTNRSHRPVSVTSGVLAVESVRCNGHQVIPMRSVMVSYAGNSFGADRKEVAGRSTIEFVASNVSLFFSSAGAIRARSKIVVEPNPKLF